MVLIINFKNLKSFLQAMQHFICLFIDNMITFIYYNSTNKYLHIMLFCAIRYVCAFSSIIDTAETNVNYLKQMFNT